jgi:preprotein translocase subunit SecG
MNIVLTVILVVHVLVAMGIIGLVLIQHGKGADMGASFGGGSSGSLFGATGSANFLSRFTAILATIFFLTSLGLAYLATNKPRDAGVMGVGGSVVVPAEGVAKPEKGGAAQPASGDAPQSKANEVPK